MPSKKKTQDVTNNQTDRPSRDWWPAPIAEKVREIMAGDTSANGLSDCDARFMTLVMHPEIERVCEEIGPELRRVKSEFAPSDQLDQWVADDQYNILYQASHADSRLTWRQSVPHPRKWQKDVEKIQHHAAELRALLNDHVTGVYASADEAWAAMLAPRQFTPWDVFDRVAWGLLSTDNPEYVSLVERYQRTRFSHRRQGALPARYWATPDARTMLNTLDVELEILQMLAARAVLPRSWHMRNSDNFAIRVYVRERYKHFKSLGLSPRSNSDGLGDGFPLYSIIAKIANVALALTDDALSGEDVRKMIPKLEQ